MRRANSQEEVNKIKYPQSKIVMDVGECCRFCNTNMRIKGTLTNTTLIFAKKAAGDGKNVNELLIALGLTLSKEPSRLFRISTNIALSWSHRFTIVLY